MEYNKRHIFTFILCLTPCVPVWHIFGIYTGVLTRAWWINATDPIPPKKHTRAVSQSSVCILRRESPLSEGPPSEEPKSSLPGKHIGCVSIQDPAPFERSVLYLKEAFFGLSLKGQTKRRLAGNHPGRFSLWRYSSLRHRRSLRLTNQPTNQLYSIKLTIA